MEQNSKGGDLYNKGKGLILKLLPPDEYENNKDAAELWIVFREMYESLPPVNSKEFSEDIDTIGKCANCGVEFHIHKEVNSKEDWVKIIGNNVEENKYMLFYNGHWIGVGKYEKREDEETMEPEYSDETGEYIYPIPTHFQPLPSPPKQL